MAGWRSICRTRAAARDRAFARRVAARGAYTLVELLIVVALLTVILSLTLPSVRQLAARSELQDAARLVRVRLLEARLAAIDSGNLTYFRYQLGGDQFEVGQAGTLPSADQAAGLEAAPLGVDGGDFPAATEPQRLPLGMQFVDPAAEPPLETPVADDGGVAELAWSEPLLFFPNGRTLNARLALANASHRVALSIRGLTGTVQVSRAERFVLPDAERETQAAPVPSVSVSPSGEGDQP